jgi:thiosulfate reductase cytochrome b subunit
MARTRRPQPLLIRLTHWINVPVLVIMAMSGLQILRAYPYFGPQGAHYDWVPLQGWIAPAWMRAGGWLAGARHLHFAFAWLLVINALIYFAYLAWSGEWRRRLFWPPRDTRPALHQLRWSLRLREQAPARDLYDSLQRGAYTAALVLGILEVLSGLALWKPIQLHRLTWLMGGYDGARVIHFLALLGLAGFVIVHLAMVIVRWRRLPEMITGGRPPAEGSEGPTERAP